jgi:hypothetical protein
MPYKLEQDMSNILIIFMPFLFFGGAGHWEIGVGDNNSLRVLGLRRTDPTCRGRNSRGYMTCRQACAPEWDQRSRICQMNRKSLTSSHRPMSLPNAK